VTVALPFLVAITVQTPDVVPIQTVIAPFGTVAERLWYAYTHNVMGGQLRPGNCAAVDCIHIREGLWSILKPTQSAFQIQLMMLRLFV
jgi:hypothetical protein